MSCLHVLQDLPALGSEQLVQVLGCLGALGSVGSIPGGYALLLDVLQDLSKGLNALQPR